MLFNWLGGLSLVGVWFLAEAWSVCVLFGLGGPIVRSVRRNAADIGEIDDVSLYRDSSAAPVLDIHSLKTHSTTTTTTTTTTTSSTTTTTTTITHFGEAPF